MTSECSTAHNVRKSQQSPARAPVGITLTEQHSLEPRPAAREGASRARNCAATSVFSFDGSTAVFFLGRQKENGGGKLRVTTRDHAPFGAAVGRHAGSSCPTGGCGESPRLPGPAAHSGASAPAGARKWVGIAAKIIPKGAINLGQSLSQPAADSSLYTREPSGT